MLKIKQGVRIQGITVELFVGVFIVVEEFAARGYDTVITSVTGGKHRSEHSLHYSGNACDFRASVFPETIDRKGLVLSVQSALGGNYDFIDEGTHFHLEYQPTYTLD